MLDYESFKDVVVKEFKRHLPMDYAGFEVNIKKVSKVNRQLDGLFVVDKTIFQTAIPSLYVNNMYDRYKLDGDIDKVLDEYAVIYKKAAEEKFTVPSIDESFILDNVIASIINTEQNEEFLQDKPHRELNDLSLVYRVVVKNDDTSGIGSFVVQNDTMERAGLTEEILYKHAYENTKRILPVTVQSMDDVMRGIIRQQGLDGKETEDLLSVISEASSQSMYVMTNNHGLHGATSIIYDEYLQKIAEAMKSDLYILPSSINEVILVSAKAQEAETLVEMVEDINMSQVMPEERLSNSVYMYDRNSREITMAAHSPSQLITDEERENDSHDMNERKGR